MTSDSYNGIAVITGASSGIGAVYADRLAHRGFDLLLVARQKDRLESLSASISSSTGRRVEFIKADLLDPADLRNLEDRLRSDDRITMLVNNAGVGSSQSILEANVEEMTTMISLDVVALVRLTYALAPRLARRSTGTIVNISSIVALAPEILNGVYGGSKAFVLAFTQSLHHELKSRGVRVQAVLPGGTRTEFWDVARSPIASMTEERQSRMMAVGDVVDAALAGLDLGELVTLPAVPDAAFWNSLENARQAIRPHLTGSTPASRYRIS